MNRRDFIKRTLAVASVATVPIGIASNTAAAKLREDQPIGDISEPKVVDEFDCHTEYGRAMNLPPAPTDADIESAFNELIADAKACLPPWTRFEIRAEATWLRMYWYSVPTLMHKDTSWYPINSFDRSRWLYKDDRRIVILGRLIT